MRNDSLLNSDWCFMSRNTMNNAEGDTFMSIFITQWIIESEKASERQASLRWRNNSNIENSENSCIRPAAQTTAKVKGGRRAAEWWTIPRDCRPLCWQEPLPCWSALEQDESLATSGSAAQVDIWPLSGEIFFFTIHLCFLYGISFLKC